LLMGGNVIDPFAALALVFLGSVTMAGPGLLTGSGGTLLGPQDTGRLCGGVVLVRGSARSAYRSLSPVGSFRPFDAGGGVRGGGGARCRGVGRVLCGVFVNWIVDASILYWPGPAGGRLRAAGGPGVAPAACVLPVGGGVVGACLVSAKQCFCVWVPVWC